MEGFKLETFENLKKKGEERNKYLLKVVDSVVASINYLIHKIECSSGIYDKTFEFICNLNEELDNFIQCDNLSDVGFLLDTKELSRLDNMLAINIFKNCRLLDTTISERTYILRKVLKRLANGFELTVLYTGNEHMNIVSFSLEIKK